MMGHINTEGLLLSDFYQSLTAFGSKMQTSSEENKQLRFCML